MISESELEFQSPGKHRKGCDSRHIKINTLIREVESSVSRLSDFAIADMNKSSVGDPPPRTNDFLQRIEAVDIQSSLNTVQEGLLAEVKALLSKDRGPNLPKGQHLPPHRSEASPVWGNNIIRLASASPITSTPMQTKGITALHRSSPLLPFGEIIYNNALMMHLTLRLPKMKIGKNSLLHSSIGASMGV